MNGTAGRSIRLGSVLLGLVALGWIVTVRAAGPYEHGFPTDWTHQHVIFSEPGTAEQAAQVMRNPRYWQQWIRQHMVRKVSAGEMARDESPVVNDTFQHVFPEQSQGLWSQNMGTGATAGAGNFPAKYSFSITTANCNSGGATQPDFVVFATGLASSSTKPSILAYDNIYSGCAGFGTVPTVYWAYDTSLGATAETIKTSPALSFDGSQIAFVQTDGTHAALVLLKWKANNGTLAAPVAPTNVAASAYPGCAAPCMTVFNLLNGATQTNDTLSSVYVDYTVDTGWVGDTAGLLHKFNPVFGGTPAEATSPWPVKVNAAAATVLTSPVYDYISDSVFTADAGGYLERTSNTTGVATVSKQLDAVSAIVASPILDVTSGNVYVFAGNDGTTNCAAGAACAGVFQFSTAFASGAGGSETRVGASKAAGPRPLYGGAFDSSYYSSGNATGNLYVCGDTGAEPILYQIPIAAGVMPAAATQMSPVTTTASTTTCSPITDIPNANLSGGSEERIFLSPENNGRPTICGGKGCVESFVVTPWKASTNYVVGQQVLNSKIHIEIVIAAGQSSTTQPTWPATTGTQTVDGGVTWLDQGAVTAAALAPWQANHAIGVRGRILDSNKNIEIATTTGTSGATQPVWPTTPGATTTGDGTVNWINAGPLPTAAIQTTGGASGIIMDNVVSTGTLAGGSQVYFSTLGNQLCTTGGTGGCAMQASQSGLQ